MTEKVSFTYFLKTLINGDKRSAIAFDKVSRNDCSQSPLSSFSGQIHSDRMKIFQGEGAEPTNTTQLLVESEKHFMYLIAFSKAILLLVIR